MIESPDDEAITEDDPFGREPDTEFDVSDISIEGLDQLDEALRDDDAVLDDINDLIESDLYALDELYDEIVVLDLRRPETRDTLLD